MEKYGMSNIPFFNYYVLFYKKTTNVAQHALHKR